MSIKYDGSELVVALEEYSEEVEKWAKKGILKVTNVIHNTASSLAPVDQGFLRESITFDLQDGGLTGVVQVGAGYSIYVEYGTGIYATGTGGSHAKKIPWSYKGSDGKWHTTKGQRAQPFWAPAMDAGREAFNKYFS